jgi:hypothetical protein
MLTHQEGDRARAGRAGVAHGVLPMTAGTPFHGRRKSNGSACQRRTMPADPTGAAPQATGLVIVRTSITLPDG